MFVIQLECGCNNYPWGKKGKESLAAKYAAATPGDSFKLDRSKEDAERWMGTYPTNPSSIFATGEDLQKHLNANKEKLIGKPILDKFGVDLPFLPRDPEKFSNANHKPEIAAALGKFEVFVGWNLPPPGEIQALFSQIPILASRFLPRSTSKQEIDHEALKQITLRKTVEKDFSKSSYIPELPPRLAEQYSKSDPRNLVALLTMNYMVFQKGESIQVPAYGIHVYLSGDMVECMARSDNVPKTGFCPRADRGSNELFTATLTFSPKPPEEALLKPKPCSKGLQNHTQILAPPMSEFNILVTSLTRGEEETIEGLKGPTIVIVTGGKEMIKGDGKDFEVKGGYVFFVGLIPNLSLWLRRGWRLILLMQRCERHG